MPDQVSCGNCGTVLDEPPESRKPCPVCGSTARNFVMNAEPGVYVLTGAEATLQHVNSSASLVLKTVVTFGEKTDKGRIVTSVTIPWFEIIEILKKDPMLAHKISPRKWEEIIAGAYRRQGFDPVTLTPPSGDGGRDVIAVKREGGVLLGTVRVIDQVKAYKPGHLVTAEDARALLGVLSAEPASKGFLTTTSDFAPRLKDDALIAPFIPIRIELINGAELLRRLVAASSSPLPREGQG